MVNGDKNHAVDRTRSFIRAARRGQGSFYAGNYYLAVGVDPTHAQFYFRLGVNLVTLHTTRAIPFSAAPNYMDCCQMDGLQGARLGVPRDALWGDAPMAELTPVVAEAFARSLDIIRQYGTIIVEDTDFAEFDTILTSKLPGMVKASDFRLMISHYLSKLVGNPSGINNLHDLIEYTQNDPREDYPSKGTGGVENAAKVIEDQNNDEFMCHIANESGVWRRYQETPGVPHLGGYPMISVFSG